MKPCKPVYRLIWKEVKEKFPEVEFIEVTESPEDPDDLWINVTTPADEDRETALIKFSGEQATNILLDYGYHILIMPRSVESLATS